MSTETLSPIFVLPKPIKEDAVRDIAKGIQQLQWQRDYVQAQYDALPPLPDDAPAELKQARAKNRVTIDTMEQKLDDQIAFYNFCKTQIS